jgi:predicted alpha/beta-hydrolase family hydrolase
LFDNRILETRNQKRETFHLRVSEPVGEVSCLLVRPPEASSLLVLGHGAGAGMRHPFLEDVCSFLAERKVATLRYQFPYREAKKKRPDVARVLVTTVEAAVNRGRELAQGLPLLAGGKSMGGRMTSLAHSQSRLEGVRGLVFLGFPLHPPGKPSSERGLHLHQTAGPLLFLQGTRDAFSQKELLQPLLEDLGPRARLHWVEGGDHSFRVPKRSGRTQTEVLEELADTIVEWSSTVRSPG